MKKLDQRKVTLSPAEKKRVRELREKFQRERPSLDDLIASGEYEGPIKHGVILDAMQVAHLLKVARKESRMSLATVSARCGLDRSAISRLENGVYENTTLQTLSRLAAAYGKRFVVALEDSEK
jgi:DNA-binding Xre family transcriptional regulator